jgi:hypothetical protein
MSIPVCARIPARAGTKRKSQELVIQGSAQRVILELLLLLLLLL